VKIVGRRQYRHAAVLDLDIANIDVGLKQCLEHAFFIFILEDKNRAMIEHVGNRALGTKLGLVLGKAQAHVIKGASIVVG
jgi:hypothetical protein